MSKRAGRCAIAIMAKAPEVARVKTRLLPLLRPDEARALSACFLRDMTQMLVSAGRAALDVMSSRPPSVPGDADITASPRLAIPAGRWRQTFWVTMRLQVTG